MLNGEGDRDILEGENELSDNGSDSIKILITSDSDIWDVFERVSGTKNALCFICYQFVSFATSISNLIKHLKLKHTNVYDVMFKVSSSPGDGELPGYFKDCTFIWEFFEQDDEDETTTCNDCLRIFSYRDTIGDLKSHLKLLHGTSYKKFINLSKSNGIIENDCDNYTLEQIKQMFKDKNILIGDSCEKFRPRNESLLWDYFKKKSFSRVAVCHLCHHPFSYKSTTGNLKIHLKRKHKQAYEEYLLKEQRRSCEYEHQLNKISEKIVNNNRKMMVDNSEDITIPDHTVDLLQRNIIENNEISPSHHGSCDERFDCEQSFSGLNEKKCYRKDNSSHKSLSSITTKEVCEGENSLRVNSLNQSQDEPKKDIWKHYNLNHETKIAQCNLCYQNISYKINPSILELHLREQHRQVYNNCASLSSPQSKDIYTITIAASEEQDIESCINEIHCSETLSINNHNGNRQSTSERDPFDGSIMTSANTFKQLQKLKQNTLSPEEKKVLDWHLLKIITEDLQPFNIVDDKGFKEFVTLLNPHYQLPDNMLSTKILTDEYDNRLEKYQNMMQICSSCTLTLECWLSKSLQRFIAVTAHFINEGTFQFHSVLLKCVSLQSKHTPDTIASELLCIISSWDILNKVKLIVSENILDIVAASGLLNLSHFECYLSKFNSVILEAINEVSISDIVRKVQQTVEYFEINIEAKQKLFDYQVVNLGIEQPKNLSISIPSQWHSVYEMLMKFCNLREALNFTILGITDDIPIISSEEWQFIKEIVEVLKPFDQAITLMSNEGYLQASKAVVLTAGLHIECTSLLESDFCDPAKRLISKLKQGLHTKFSDLENNKEISICTLLDPRFHQHAFNNREAMLNAKQYLLEKFEEIKCSKDNEDTPISSSSADNLKPLSLWDHFYTKVASSYSDERHKTDSELNKYFNEDVIPQTECPLKWWKERQTLYPVLSKIFIKSFNTVVTSLRCDRAFSKSCYNLMDRQKLLASEVDKIMFLHANK